MSQEAALARLEAALLADLPSADYLPHAIRDDLATLRAALLSPAPSVDTTAFYNAGFQAGLKAIMRPDLPPGIFSVTTGGDRPPSVPPVSEPGRMDPDAVKLWDLLDHIDTLSDMMKPEKTPYYEAVQKTAAKRFHVFTSDGYRLFKPEPTPATSIPAPSLTDSPKKEHP